MYTSFLNHYYLANVHQAIALDQTRKQIIEQPATGNVSEVTTTSELDRLWLRHLRIESNQG